MLASVAHRSRSVSKSWYRSYWAIGTVNTSISISLSQVRINL
ncbi:MAG: hypothetical protein V7K27_29340 [Nostoc sp.]